MKKYALIVGVSRYDDPEIGNLNFAADDAREVGACLSEVCGFDEIRTLITGGEKEPDHISVVEALHSFAPILNQEDLFLFYFAGHGIHTSNGSFLLASNSRIRMPELAAVPMPLLQQCLSRLDAAERVLILDACRNDPQQGRGDSDNLLTQEFSRDILAVAKAPCEGVAPATCVLFSCSEGERAYEWPDKRHGSFTWYLLDGMRGAALDPQGRLTIQGLSRYVEEHVPRWSKKTGLPRAQTPWAQQLGSLRDICLATRQMATDNPRSRVSPPNREIVNRTPQVSNPAIKAVVQFRERVLCAKLKRLSQLARGALIRLDDLEKPVDKENIFGLMLASVGALAQVPYCDESVWLDQTARQFAFRCRNVFYLVPEIIEHRFSKADGSKTIQDGLRKNGSYVESKTSYYVRVAYIYSIIFDDKARTEEALRRAIQSDMDAGHAGDIALAHYVLLHNENAARTYWRNVARTTCSSSGYVSLAYQACVMPGSSVDPCEYVSRAERVANNCDDYCWVAGGHICVSGDLNEGKRVLQKAVERLPKDADSCTLIDISPFIGMFADAGDAQFAASVLAKVESKGFPDIMPGSYGEYLALAWYDLLGDADRAAAALDKARDVVERSKSERGDIFSITSLGRAYILIGMRERGREMFKKLPPRIKPDVVRDKIEGWIRSCGENSKEFVG